LVVALAVGDEAYAGRVAPRWDAEVLGMHRRTTSLADAAGRTQLPWPRLLGTPPWSFARARSAMTGRRHVVRRRTLAGLLSSIEEGVPVGLYVGSRWLPRHVVLALSATDTHVHVYDPARGAVVPLPLEDLRRGRVDVGGWTRWWWAVVPRSA
jgi:hypothetical protein